MKIVLLRWFGLVSLLLGLFVSPLPVKVSAASSQPVSVPIVFTLRNHLDTIDGVNVGPPVEILGREKIVGGKLVVLYPDSRLVDLTSDKLFDVSRPMVSFDGKRIVFSGVQTSKSQWHIFEINLDGTGFRQLTFDDRTWEIPADPRSPKTNQALFRRYGDFSPAYLPDGRIIFSSSRYPSLSASCGQRALNLYVMSGNGTEMHRITTERAGAIDPYVLANGRVIFSHWVDNMNIPSPVGSGLAPLEVERNLAGSFWILWATNPDGTGAGRSAFTGGKFKDSGGIFQAREMPDGQIVYTYRSAGNLLSSTLSTGIAILTPGAGAGNSVKGIGDPSGLEGAHALSPTPLPDGRILFSYTPSSSVIVDNKGRTTAQFNYGLYLTDSKFQDLSLVYDDPNMDELDAVAVYPRTAKVISDVPGATNITDNPTVDLGTTVVLKNSNIYADLPLNFREIVSPLVGSVVAIDFYDDTQTFTSSDSFPMVRKQPPRFIGSVPVNPDGSFTATVPADRPIFWLLRTATGVVNRTVSSPVGEQVTSFVPTHDYFRPGTVVQCIGCHRGHMINPEFTKEAKTNLARLATASASSSLDTYNFAPWRVNDGRLGDELGRYSWASNDEKMPWVQLFWMQPVSVNEVVLYPRTEGGNRVKSGSILFSDGSTVSVATPLNGAPVTVSFPARNVYWLRFQVESGEGHSLGLAELAVHGDQGASLPFVSPVSVQGLKVTEDPVVLTWSRNPEPYIGGYRIYYGKSSSNYTQVLDVGNVNQYLMTGLENGMTYYLAVKAYTIPGKESLGYSKEVKVTFFTPEIESLSVTSGLATGGTAVTIIGRHFSSRGVTVLLGGTHARVISISPMAIEVVTKAHSAGMVDVLIINADGSRDTLPEAFTYLK